MWATYFTGIFRSMRFGIEDAHARGSAVQYGYLLEKGAFSFDTDSDRFVLDEARMGSALSELLTEELMLQALGDYVGTASFFARYAALDEHAEVAIARMTHIPVDIRPIYPRQI